MRSSKALRLCEAICLFYVFLAPLNAQLSRNGAVSGVVTGPDDSLIPKATIAGNPEIWSLSRPSMSALAISQPL